MSSHTFQQPKFIASAKVGVMLLVRWLLVLIIALDLVGAPFHAHHHEGGPDGYANQASALNVDHQDQFDDDEARSLHAAQESTFQGGHSMSALRGISSELAPPESAPKLLALISLFVFVGLLLPPLAGIFVRWRPGRERVQIPHFRTVPPGGRAPPSLHV